MPFTPGGAPGMRASTRWTMFSVTSCSPAEIHILLPNRRNCGPNGESPSGSARVATSASDEPACGSERHMVPANRPSSSGRANASICAGEPCASSRLAFAAVSSG